MKIFNINNIRLNLEFFLLIGPFFVISILYYFLRFQFELDHLVLIFYTLLQIAITLGAIFKLFKFLNKCHGFIDKLVLLISIHFIYLLFFTLFRNFSSTTFLYVLKDFFTPICLYWYIRFSLNLKYLRVLLNLILILSLIVSVIYLTDFYLKGIMGEPTLIYLEKIRNLTMEKSNSSVLSGTIVKGDVFNLFRFEGPLGHNSPTSVFISLGVVISILKLVFKTRGFNIIFLSVCVLALIISANRTALFACILTLIIHLSIFKYNSINLFRFLKFGILFIFILTIIFAFIEDNPFGFIFSFDSIFRNLDYILFSNKEFIELLPFFYIPFLWFGVGFPIVGGDSFLIDIVRSDDFFLIQLISIYGILFLYFLYKYLFNWYQKIKQISFLANREQLYVFYSFSCIIIILLFSVLHAGTLIRPQIFPLFFASLAALSKILNSSDI